MRQVGVDSLKISDVLAKTIYSSKGRVLLGKGVRLTPLYIGKLRDMGISIVYVEDERFNDVVIDDVISEEHRREAMQIIEVSTQAVRLGRDFDGFQLKTFVSKVVEEILFQKDILVSMMDMRSRDNYVFSHSVNVCVLAIVLGKAMLLDREKLESLAIGALLHDIGKIHFDETFLQNTESFTSADVELMKTHTTLGFEDLRKKKELNLAIAHIAFQHHEAADGSGYPRGLKEGEIHPLAQIVCLVDLYDRLISDHSGILRVMPHIACEILMGHATRSFPLELVRTFLKNVAVYPTGVMVKLNNCEIGVVVDQNLSMPSRPVVRVLEEELGVGKGKAKEYNMVNTRTLFIDEVMQ
ncbi:MAG: HD domain-containing phosphohydrolase [Desulfitobacteriaceae bacterium]